MQLGALKFVTVSEWTWATPECKPTLYLYPEKPTRLTVKLRPAGKLTATDPVYNEETGWQVIAYPDGTIIHLGGVMASSASWRIQPVTPEVAPQSSKNKVGTPRTVEKPTYPYLYYEARLEKVKTPKKGWVVKKEKLEGLFNELLPFLGLKGQEIQDFKEYWLKALDKAPYYFVGVVEQEEIERIEPIWFSLNPLNNRFLLTPLTCHLLPKEPALLLLTGEEFILRNLSRRGGFKCYQSVK